MKKILFEPAETYSETLVDTVIDQIQLDLEAGDATAIYDLLKNHVSESDLESFLPEERLAEIRG